ncbi:unnamed protein product [Heterobilharzia americana]|nr:unnamed protein product [Heterobilharzia americana]
MNINAILCAEVHKNMTDYFESMNISYCQATVNSIHQCWPPTSAGHVAKLPCPSNVTSFHYDENDDSFRQCLPNGTWAEIADYSACTILYPLIDEYLIFLCFLIGYIISMISVISGITILQYFHSLRCIRNNIHTHLMIAILLRATSWICLAILNTTTLLNSLIVSNILTCVLAFGMIAVYSWMLIEGVHLLNILFLTFTVRRFRFSCYSMIGWGVPAILTSSWAIAKSLKLGNTSLWPEPTTSDPEGILVVTSILITLAVNFLIMFITIFMLLTKLRGQPSGMVGRRVPSGYKKAEKRMSRGGCRPIISSTHQSETGKPATSVTPTTGLIRFPQQSQLSVDKEEIKINDNTENRYDNAKSINETTSKRNNSEDTKYLSREEEHIVFEILPTVGPVQDTMTTVTSGTRQKCLKPSIKRFTNSITSTNRHIAPPNPSISEMHPKKTHITITKQDQKSSEEKITRIISNSISGSSSNTYPNNVGDKKCTANSSFRRSTTGRQLKKRSSEISCLSTSSLSIKELRKAVKAIIFLMPLLGFSQLIFLIPYSKEFGRVFDYINAVVLSTQGFWVALIYCFLNSEVQRVLRTRWRIICSTLHSQSSERGRQKQSLTIGPISQNNFDTEYQRQ